jgi:hypothetical protein
VLKRDSFERKSTSVLIVYGGFVKPRSVMIRILGSSSERYMWQ